jgi:protein-tyrosine phosphatase
VPNIATFYEKSLDSLPRPPRSHYHAHLHGDLNGANVIIDGQGNVWLIDFFHSHRGHILKDLAKFENDLLFIWTPLANESELEQALELSDLLLSVEDLGAPLPALDVDAVRSPQLQRAYRIVQHLRGYYPDLLKKDREPNQLLIAQVRYAVHTLGFDESSELQRRWALYAASSAAARLRRRLKSTSALRIDWLPAELSRPGRIGLTWLPGRRDAGRSLEEDIMRIREEGVTSVVCLLAKDEFARYGVDDLLDRYRQAGLGTYHVPTLDGGVPADQELKAAVSWVEAQRRDGQQVLIHCVGGLGRAGTVAACWLRTQGFGTEDAIAVVRRVRSARAIETEIQERTIAQFSNRAVPAAASRIGG